MNEARWHAFMQIGRTDAVDFDVEGVGVAVMRELELAVADRHGKRAAIRAGCIE